MGATGYAHIELRNGVPYVEGTRMKVEMVAIDRTVWLWDADAIQRQYPDLSLGQIHSALAYYYDHKEEIDAAIEEGERFVEEMRAKHRGDTENLKERLRQKLQEMEAR